MTFGVTPTGYVRPTVQELLALIESDQLGTISASLGIGPEDLIGQLNGIFARQLAIAYEGQEIAYNAPDPDRAEEFLLTAIAKLTGTRRYGAQPSKVTLSCYLNSGTQLIADDHTVHVAGATSNTWTPDVTFTAPSTGLHDVSFRSTATGQVVALSGTITVIATPVDGWVSVTNALAATLGKVADSDATLRKNRDQDLARAGSATVDAIASDIAALGDWVVSVDVVENATSATDGDGRPPNSFEVMLLLEGEPTGANHLIAQAIWGSKPGGNRSYGNGTGSGTAHDRTTRPHVITYTVVAPKPIHIAYELSVVPGFTNQAGVKDYVVEQCRKQYPKTDTEVIALFVKALPLNVAGVLDVTDFDIAFTGPPSGSANLVIPVREVASFAVADIDITLA